MLELEVARQRMLDGIVPLPHEDSTLANAHGRFLAADVFSTINLPPFDNSAMDGYAVRTADAAFARRDVPVRLRVAGRVAAGELFAGTVEPGCCVRLFTGSPLPAGADAVLMQEDTKPVPDSDGLIEVLEGIKPWENVRFRGEDVKGGSRVVQAGDRITAGRLALLGALGLTRVTVGRRPRVALLATGTELVEPGQPLAPGQIYESNRLLLATLLSSAGAVPHLLPLVPDRLADTREALRRAFEDHDAVVTSGGVSVGEFDFVKPALEELGGTLDFWKVAIKPGKPFVFGHCQAKPFFGLPGNPVSAAVTCILLVGPAVRRLQGATDVQPDNRTAMLEQPLRNTGDRRHFMRVHVDGMGRCRPAGVQASHLLGSLAAANGLVDVPPGSHLPAETQVAVIQLG